MILRMYNLEHGTGYYVAKKIEDCKCETDRQLWKMHEKIYDSVWVAGTSFAVRIE